MVEYTRKDMLAGVGKRFKTLTDKDFLATTVWKRFRVVEFEGGYHVECLNLVNKPFWKLRGGYELFWDKDHRNEHFTSLFECKTRIGEYYNLVGLVQPQFDEIPIIHRRAAYVSKY